MKERKILFICSGCTCRSPMATYITMAKIKEQRLQNAEVTCRGLFVERQSSVSENVVRALNILGVPVRKKIVPTELEKSDLLNATYCFCMTAEHKAIIKTKFGFDVKTIAEAADYIEIADPYGGNLEDYIGTAKQLDVAIEQIIERLFKEEKL